MDMFDCKRKYIQVLRIQQMCYNLHIEGIYEQAINAFHVFHYMKDFQQLFQVLKILVSELPSIRSVISTYCQSKSGLTDSKNLPNLF